MSTSALLAARPGRLKPTLFAMSKQKGARARDEWRPVRVPAGPLCRPLHNSAPHIHAWAICLIVVLAIVTFLNSLGGGFVFDDQRLIVENPAIRRFTDIPRLFSLPYWADQGMDRLYRPVVMVTYALNYAIGGLNPFGYHLVNVLLHAGNSALVYLLLRSLFQSSVLAFLAAGVFAVHPVHTEAVANVAGRADLLASVGFLGGLLLALKADGATGWCRAGYRAGSVGAFAAALLSKEHAVMLLGVLVLSDLLRHVQRTGGLAGAGQALAKTMRQTYPFYLVAFAAYMLARFLVLGTIMHMATYSDNNPLLGVEWPTRILTAIAVLGRYCRLLLVPLHLSADYSYAQIPLSRSPSEAAVLMPVFGLLAATAGAGLAWRRRPVFAFGLVLGLVIFAPTANVLFPIGTIMAERLLYLPCLGFCLLLGAAVTELHAFLPRHSASRAVLLVACGALLVFYIGRSVVRNRDWQSPLTLWQATVRSSPRSAKARYNLGAALLTRGDFVGSEREIRVALQIHPQAYLAYNELGGALMRQGRSGEAIAAFEAALRIRPDFAPAHVNVGRLYERQGLGSLALKEYRLAAAHASSFPSTSLHLALASVFFGQGDLGEAERWLTLVIRTQPSSAEAHFDLGTVYRKQGKLSDAVAAFQEAVRLKPQYPKAHYALGVVLAQQGRAQEARQAFEAAERQWRPAPSGERP